jgi:HEAT repeat protein
VPVPKAPSLLVKAAKGPSVRVTLLKNGTLVLRLGRRGVRRGGQRFKIASATPKGVALWGRLVTVSQYKKRYRLLHIRARGPQTFEAVLWLRGRTFVKIWAGSVGFQGVDKEWSRHLIVDPANKRVPVVLYENMRGLWRCDDVPAQGLRRGYVFTSRRFVPMFVALPKSGGIKSGGIVQLTATVQAPSGVRTKPLAPFRFTAASSQVGCAGQASRVTPPSELHDGRPQTAWAEEWAGVGRGEFVSGSGIRGYRVRALRIIPGHAGSAAKWTRHNRLKRIYLLFGPKRRYEVTFPQDPGQAAPGTAYWVVFPKPVKSSCLTLMIKEAYPGTEYNKKKGKFGDTAISEVTVFTDIDFGNAHETIIRDAGRGRLERLTAVRMLLRMGRGVAPKLRAAFPKAVSSAEREVVLRALARLDPTGSVKELAVGLREARGALRRQLFDALARAGDAAVPALGALLGRRLPGALQKMLVLTLVRIGTDGAAGALVTALQKSRARPRARIVSGLRLLPPARVKAPLHAALRVAKQPARVRADLVRLLGLMAVRHRTMRPDAVAAAMALITGDTRFAVRYRVIELMRDLAEPVFVKALLAIATTRVDPILRAEAVEALARFRQKGARLAVRRALKDANPRVRGAAVAAWGSGAAGQRAGHHAGQVAVLAQSDPWPMVRIAATQALGARCQGGKALLGLARKRTGWRYKRVRRIALNSAFRCKVRGLRPLLHAILTSDSEWVPLRALSARLLGELRDRGRVRYMAEFLGLLAKQVRKPHSRNEVLAADLAVALGKIRDKRALKSLTVAASIQLLPQLRAAALGALGGFCDPASKKVVKAGLTSTSRLVISASRRTIRTCGW